MKKVEPIEKVSIRVANVHDIPAITAVAEATWEPTYRDFIDPKQIAYMFDEIYNPVALQRQMEDLGHTFLLMQWEDQPVAFASYSPRPEDPGVYKLHKIYLLPSQQGKGLGKRLMEEVTQRVRKEGGTAIDLNVNRHNPARYFYERCGFRIIYEEDIPIGPYWMNDYVMRKII